MKGENGHRRSWTITSPGRSAIYRNAAGALVNALGSDAAAVAFGFFLYDRTGSAVWLSAWYFLSFGITGVLGPVFGWLADHYDRRRIIIAANLAAACCSLALILTTEPAILVGIAFVASIIGRSDGPAFTAAIPNLVGDEELEWANGTIGVAFNIGRLTGPVVGGALYVAGGRSVVFALDAATFVFGALTIWSLRIPFRAQAEDGNVGETQPGLLHGFRVVFGDTSLRSLLIVWTALYFAVDISLVGELPLARAMGVGAFAFGILEAAWGGGSTVGSLLGRRVPKERDTWAVLVGALGVVLGYLAIVVSPWFILVIAAMGGVAVCDAIGTVAGFSLIQRHAADDVRGRVFSTYGTLGLMANAVAFAIAGFLVEAVGPRGIFALGAVVAAIAAPFLAPMFRERRNELAITEPPAGGPAALY